ncbi:MAG: hypothetical protein ABWX69_04560 [Arthrobacter sp.]
MDTGSRYDLPAGDRYDDEPSDGARERRRWPWAAAVVALAVAAVAGSVAVAGNMGSVTPAPAAASTPPAATTAPAAATPPSAAVASTASVPPSASATPPPSDAATPPSGAWQSFTSADGKVSFDYPAAWNVSTPAGAADSGAVDVDVANEAGMVVASLYLGAAGGLGGACQGAVPYAVLDSVEVGLPYQPSKGSVTPRFAFRALQEADRVTASFGLTDSPAGQNGTTCMFHNVVNGAPGTPTYTFADAFQVRAGDPEEIPGREGAKSFPSMDAARAYMQTPEYLNARRMISSLTINPG